MTMKKKIMIVLSSVFCLVAGTQAQGIENVDCLFDEALQVKKDCIDFVEEGGSEKECAIGSGS